MGNSEKQRPRTARYLLTAPDEDLARWKKAAKDFDMSFAAWLREAAELRARGGPEVFEDKPLRPSAVLEKIKLSDGLELSGKKTYHPDPK